MSDAPEARWFYKGEPCQPDGAEAERGKPPTALWFKLESGLRVRVPVNPDTGKLTTWPMATRSTDALDR